MSKAFTREENEGHELPEIDRPVSALPPGMVNYMTADGAERLRDELARLVQIERPSLLAKKDNPDAKERLRPVEQRILQLEEGLQTAQVISHTKGPAPSVTFGASVTIRGPEGEEKFRIVGVDETDLDEGRISWLSPVARALMNAKVGERVRFKYPCGEEQVEVLSINYE